VWIKNSHVNFFNYCSFMRWGQTINCVTVKWSRLLDLKLIFDSSPINRSLIPHFISHQKFSWVVKKNLSSPSFSLCWWVIIFFSIFFYPARSCRYLVYFIFVWLFWETLMCIMMYLSMLRYSSYVVLFYKSAVTVLWNLKMN